MLKSSQSCLAGMLQGKEGQQSILHWGAWCTVKQSMAQQSIFSAALRQKKKTTPLTSVLLKATKGKDTQTSKSNSGRNGPVPICKPPNTQSLSTGEKGAKVLP